MTETREVQEDLETLELETLSHAARRHNIDESYLRRRVRYLRMTGAIGDEETAWPRRGRIWGRFESVVAPPAWWDEFRTAKHKTATYVHKNQNSAALEVETLEDQALLRELDARTVPLYKPVTWGPGSPPKGQGVLCPNCRRSGKSNRLRLDDDGDWCCLSCARVYPREKRGEAPAG